MQPPLTALDTVLDYHQRTKHHFQRYAAGPGALDWDSQPDPFRTFADSPQLELPLLGEQTPQAQPSYRDLYQAGLIAPQALTLRNVAALLELSFGISAWKEFAGSRWALRCNPSSGNLHPTEAYLVVEACAGIPDGVHHYNSHAHVLEQRCRWAKPAGGEQRLLPPDSFLIGMSSIHWREAWKYGERAYRYCQHDLGHAIAAVRYAAAVLGWQVRLLDHCGDAAIGALLGLDRLEDFGLAEREQPDLILQVATGHSHSHSDAITTTPGGLRALAEAARDGQWQGHANVLTRHPLHHWPVIDTVADACRKPETAAPHWPAPVRPPLIDSDCEKSAADIIRQRRSAQAFDKVTSISAATLFRMLDATLPRAAVAPWDAITWQPRIHLLLFVHRIDGLAPGLYLFLRNEQAETLLRQELSADFAWQAVAECPAHLQLFRLVSADVRNIARAISCHQDIAADGAFSLGMLAEYQASLADGPWIYRHLFWEAGMLGQVLYLEAEAAGVRGTGIGCYFDDELHERLGIQGQALQSMYHFTLGGALVDARLQTLPAYGHLVRRSDEG